MGQVPSADSYEKIASTTRAPGSGCEWSGPRVKIIPEPARVVASWKTGQQQLATFMQVGTRP